MTQEEFTFAVQKNFLDVATELSWDGCVCGWAIRGDLEIHTHCWKGVCDECRWAAVHLTPKGKWDRKMLISIGSAIRTQINRPDMDIRIIIELGGKTEVIGAMPPPEGFYYYYDENGEARTRTDDFTDEDWEIYRNIESHYHGNEANYALYRDMVADGSWTSPPSQTFQTFIKTPRGRSYIVNDRGFRIPQ